MKKLLTLLLLSGFFISSCDNTLEPLGDDELYTIYGVLNVEKNTNFIRVRDITAPFTLEATENIDARVILQNINANTSKDLTSLRSEYEGMYLHNFQVDNLLPDTEYRLRIERSDGRSVELETKTPSKATFTISPDVRDCETPVTVEFGNLNGGSIGYVIGPTVVEELPFIGLNFFQAFYDRSRTLYADENNPDAPLSFTFTPSGAVRDGCNDFPENLVVTIIHHSKGLREAILPEQFDIIESSKRFGAFDIDTLEITF